MSPFRQVTPSQIEVRKGGGCLAVFGLPFLVAGLFLVWSGVASHPATEAPRLLAVFMGLPFVAVGAGLVFWRNRTVFDAAQGRIILYRGLAFSMRRVDRVLSDFSTVSIMLHTDAESADTFDVFLKARIGKNVGVYSSGNYAESLGRAEFLAEFLKMDLEDLTTDHARIVASRGQTQEVREVVDRPSILQSTVDVTSGEARITIPLRRARWPGAVASLLLVLLVAPVLAPMARAAAKNPSPGLVFFVVLFAGVPLVAAALRMLIPTRGKTVVRVSQSGIRIERYGWLRVKTTVISAGEIVALDYSDADVVLAASLREGELAARPWLASVMKKLVRSKGITVKARTGLFAFGEGLPGDEVRYLYSVVRRALGPGLAG